MVKEKELIFDLEGEEWRSVGVIKGIDFTGCYEVSNKGRFRSLDRVITYKSGFDREYKGQLLKLFKDRRGYLKVYFRLNENNISVLAHRVVALRFIPNPDPEHRTQINHKDEDKTNNCIENLEWVTNDENAAWGTKIERQIETSGTEIVQLDLEGNLIALFPSIRDVSRHLDVNHRGVSYHISRKTYIFKDYFWIEKSKYDSLKGKELQLLIQQAIYNKKHKMVPKVPEEEKVTKENSKKIVKLSKEYKLLKIYESIAKAAEDNNLSTRNIRECISGIHKTAGGFIWMRLLDYENLSY